MDERRKQIEELMCSLEPSIGGRKGGSKSWQDSEVCKHYITGLCPHDLFRNTRLFLGECTGVHDEDAKEEYLKEREKLNFKRSDYRYEELAHRFLKPIMDDCDRKIQKQTEERCNEDNMSEALQGSANKKIADIEEKIGKLNEKIEVKGKSGSAMDEIFKLNEEVEKLNDQKSKHLVVNRPTTLE
eukprot:GHVN01097499.1.p1 GENE.GHVN01097499.1~~GHVN01097499.1.p1  ORF type:complete len:185 (+),score=23.46 GHVN01097499.1:63-617(+)